MASAGTRKVRRAWRQIAQLRRNLYHTVNDEHFWDSYVREWESSPESATLPFVGSEWHNEGVFIRLLEKYAAREATALEIGCGGGRITSRAFQCFRHVNAADVSREMLRRCSRSVPAPNVSFHKLDGFTLDGFGDESVDVVYSHDVFVHFSSLQVYPYLVEIRRVLRAGGRGLISFYNFETHFDLFRRMSLDFARRRIFPPHMRVHFVTEQMIRRMLEDLDLEVTEVDTENFLIVAFQKSR